METNFNKYLVTAGQNTVARYIKEDQKWEFFMNHMAPASSILKAVRRKAQDLKIEPPTITQINSMCLVIDNDMSKVMVMAEDTFQWKWLKPIVDFTVMEDNYYMGVYKDSTWSLSAGHPLSSQIILKAVDKAVKEYDVSPPNLKVVGEYVIINLDNPAGSIVWDFAHHTWARLNEVIPEPYATTLRGLLTE